jgi:hypothetical protein
VSLVPEKFHHEMIIMSCILNQTLFLVIVVHYIRDRLSSGMHTWPSYGFKGPGLENCLPKRFYCNLGICQTLTFLHLFVCSDFFSKKHIYLWQFLPQFNFYHMFLHIVPFSHFSFPSYVGLWSMELMLKIATVPKYWTFKQDLRSEHF